MSWTLGFGVCVKMWIGDVSLMMSYEEDREWVDHINDILSGSYDEEGIFRWWYRPRHQLGGRSCAEARRDGDHEAVLELAKWLEDGGAT